MSMDGDWLMMLAILIFVLILSLKAYFLGVVWACYKYLCMNSVRGLSRSNGRQYETSGGEDAEVMQFLLKFNRIPKHSLLITSLPKA